MTVPSTARRAGPYTGNGSTTTFSFTFKTFAAGDLLVTRMDALGLETTLVLNSDYSVSLNVDQDASPGGTITYPITGAPLPAGQKLTIVGDLEYEQTTDLLGGGSFNARVIEDTFDRTVIQIQQLEERLDRALLVPVNSTANVQLPNPEPNELIGWDSAGTALQNVPLADIGTAIAYGTFRYETFTGNGSTTTFALSENPAVLANLDVSISGVVQVPGTDYSLVAGNLVFTSAPANGTTILARYGQALPVIPDSDQVSFVQAGSGAATRTAQGKMRDIVSLSDFGVLGNGSDESSKLQAAIDYLESIGGGRLVDSAKTITVTISSTINLKRNVLIELPNTTFLWGGTLLVGTMFDADFAPTPTALFFRIRSYEAPINTASTLICLKLNRVAGGDIRFGGRGGGYSIYSTASYNYRVRNLDVGQVAQAGYYHQGDLGAEIYMSDCYISFGGGFVGKYGVFIERTTQNDVGGYYFDNVLVAKGPALQSTLDQGIYIKATTYPTTMAIQMRAGGVDGAFDQNLGRYSIRLDNIATAFFTGSWFDKVGFSQCEAMVFSGCNVASGFHFIDNTNTANLLASNISCGETYAFNFRTGATVSDIIWDNIRTFPGFQLSNDMARLTAGASAHQNRTVTSSTDVEGAICWQNAADPTKRFYWRVNATGNMVLLDAAFANEVLLVRPDGTIEFLTDGTGIVLTSPNGLISKTLTIDNAGNIALL